MKQIALSLLMSLLASVAPGGYDIAETSDSISLSMEGKTIWLLNHCKEEGKPYFHPLATTAGQVFSNLRPQDHPWHRGLWFSWKKINDVNYWEEDRKTGQSEGLTQLLRIQRSVSPDKTVTLKMDLAYAPAKTGTVVMTEERTVILHPPDGSGAYRIDWSAKFHALEAGVVLDRTPLQNQPRGKSWGGYAGFSLRMNKAVLGGTFLNSEEVSGSGANRQSARWLSYTAPQGGGILMLDHPANLRYPSKWYFVEDMPFMTPAVIHDAPHTIKAGETLNLRYRLIVYPGQLNAGAAEKEWVDWIR
ncbi:MAG: PmoA family protein [Verrucomicrobia bacterium]|nr:PmoA family protein [Verrucomicrobiota bacterium]